MNSKPPTKTFLTENVQKDSSTTSIAIEEVSPSNSTTSIAIEEVSPSNQIDLNNDDVDEESEVISQGRQSDAESERLLGELGDITAASEGKEKTIQEKILALATNAGMSQDRTEDAVYDEELEGLD